MDIQPKIDILFDAYADFADIRRDASFAELCTMRVGGDISVLYAPHEKDAFCRHLLSARHMQVPFCLLGGGSNTVAGDHPFDGIVFSTANMRSIEIFETKIKADCGASINQLVFAAANAGLGGLEELYGIPGSVGGAVYMNAGAYGREIADCLVSVTAFSTSSGQIRIFSNEELAFSYRDSLLQHAREWVVLDATFQLVEKPCADLREKIKQVIRQRRASQPIGMPSAGSVFRRAERPTWELIDACGLRGYTIGGAGVSVQHAGFIVNHGNAATADICALVGRIQQQVYATHGVHLIPEIEFFHLCEEEKCLLQKR